MSEGRQQRGRRPLLLVIVAVGALSAFGFMMVGGLDDNLVYFVTPSELMEQGAQAYDAPVRLGGMVEAGSVQWDAEALDLRFRMTDGDGTIEVHANGAPPQMFRGGIGVIVEGRLTRAGVFESHNLMVKHSNEYRAPPDGHKPADVYKTLIEE